MTAEQAGQIARAAGVKRLLLTHLSPVENIGTVLAEARREFPEAQLAEEEQTYLL